MVVIDSFIISSNGTADVSVGNMRFSHVAVDALPNEVRLELMYQLKLFIVKHDDGYDEERLGLPSRRKKS